MPLRTLEWLLSVNPHPSPKPTCRISNFYSCQGFSFSKGKFRLMDQATWMWCHDTKTHQLFKTCQKKIFGCIRHLLQYCWIQESSGHRDVYVGAGWEILSHFTWYSYSKWKVSNSKLSWFGVCSQAKVDLIINITDIKSLGMGWQIKKWTSSALSPTFSLNQSVFNFWLCCVSFFFPIPK